MSRIGKQPVAVPKNVDVSISGTHLKFKGPLGELEHEVWDGLAVQYQPADRVIQVSRSGDDKNSRAMHGLHRSLIANKVQGVASGFSKRMELYGMGYSVDLRGKSLVLQIGFCHEVVFELPKGVSVDVEQKSAQNEVPAKFVIKGIDKEVVGQFAASVRAVRPPEPYKGKGLRYEGEYVRRKEGKAFAGLG
jgi:large subunit ribosomal protein L6